MIKNKTTDHVQLYPCACCGYLTAEEPAGTGTFFICPICFWEDDIRDQDTLELDEEGTTGTTLRQARKNFAEFGATEKKEVRHTREPLLPEKTIGERYIGEQVWRILRPPLHRGFELPTQKELLQLKEGDIVKLIFQVANEMPERMWVIVCQNTNPDIWTGKLDNDPLGKMTAKVLKADMLLCFHPLDIVSIDKKS